MEADFPEVVVPQMVGEIFGSLCTVALLLLADLDGFIEITLFWARLEAVGALSLLSRVGTTLES